jgi:hypothetical protein
MANEMRDRLVELIKEGANGHTLMPTDSIADHLIENGVIVLPCKVGDVVYELITIKDKSTKKINSHIVSRVVTSVHLSNRYSDKDKPYITLSAETFYKNGAYIKRVPIEAFGVTVFGTERDAEQKLKGGADNGKVY